MALHKCVTFTCDLSAVCAYAVRCKSREHELHGGAIAGRWTTLSMVLVSLIEYCIIHNECIRRILEKRPKMKLNTDLVVLNFKQILIVVIINI
jgi:hypothetical protein